jgi:hypothetical protein
MTQRTPALGEKQVRQIERALKLPKLIGPLELVEKARPIRAWKVMETDRELIEIRINARDNPGVKLSATEELELTKQQERRMMRFRSIPDAAYWCDLENKSAREIVRGLLGG